jgi:hypothetical protein
MDKNKHIGISLDEFLHEQGIFEEVNKVAIENIQEYARKNMVKVSSVLYTCPICQHVHYRIVPDVPKLETIHDGDGIPETNARKG